MLDIDRLHVITRSNLEDTYASRRTASSLKWTVTR